MRGKRNHDQPQQPNLLPPCRVCGQKGAGFHYGVTTCEACKGFFRRSLVRTEPYQCIGSYHCYIGSNIARRQSCPKCRYDKCISVGMSKSAIKTGRYSLMKKSKDIYELLQHQESYPNDDLDESMRKRVKDTLDKIKRAKLRIKAKKSVDRQQQSLCRRSPSPDVTDSCQIFIADKDNNPEAFSYHKRSFPIDELLCGDKINDLSSFAQSNGYHQSHQCPLSYSTDFSQDINLTSSLEVSVPITNQYQCKAEPPSHQHAGYPSPEVVAIQTGNASDYDQIAKPQYVHSHVPSFQDNGRISHPVPFCQTSYSSSEYHQSRIYYSRQTHQLTTLSGVARTGADIPASDVSEGLPSFTPGYQPIDRSVYENLSDSHHSSNCSIDYHGRDFHSVTQASVMSELDQYSPVTPTSSYPQEFTYSHTLANSFEGDSHSPYGIVHQSSILSGQSSEVGLYHSLTPSSPWDRPEVQNSVVLDFHDMQNGHKSLLDASTFLQQRKFEQSENPAVAFETLIARTIAGEDNW